MDDRTVVLDLGSGNTKIGFAGEEHPEYIFPSVIPNNDKTSCFEKNDLKPFELEYPIQNGQVKNWDQVEELIEHGIDRLKINPQDDAFLLTQPVKNPKKDREKLAEVMFEKYHVCALHEELQAILTHYAAGRHAGLIVEIGHGVTSVVPILGVYVINEAIMRLDMGGNDLDRYLSQMLKEKGHNLDLAVIKNIKETCCSVKTVDNSNHSAQETYILPDGEVIHLDNEKYQCPEALFDPSLVEHYDCLGIHEMIYTSITRCGIDVRRDFANNIILSGGSTLLNGLQNRLQSELENTMGSRMKISLVCNKDRELYVWIGGSILGSLSTFRKLCVSKKDYDELGVNCCKNFLNGL